LLVGGSYTHAARFDGHNRASAKLGFVLRDCLNRSSTLALSADGDKPDDAVMSHAANDSEFTEILVERDDGLFGRERVRENLFITEIGGVSGNGLNIMTGTSENGRRASPDARV